MSEQYRHRTQIWKRRPKQSRIRPSHAANHASPARITDSAKKQSNLLVDAYIKASIWYGLEYSSINSHPIGRPNRCMHVAIVILSCAGSVGCPQGGMAPPWSAARPRWTPPPPTCRDTARTGVSNHFKSESFSSLLLYAQPTAANITEIKKEQKPCNV